MMSSRSIAVTLVMLIALSCLIGTPTLRAEGPFDVDNAGGGKRLSTTGSSGGSTSGGSGEQIMMAAAIPGSIGIVGSTWFTQVVLWISFDLSYDRVIVTEGTNSTSQPTEANGNSANRLR